MPDPYIPEALIPERFIKHGETGVVSSNERKLLQLIWRNPGISRSEITGHTDLTQQSVHRILDTLTDRGVVSLGTAKPGLGRGQPSPMLRLNGDHAYACGISVNTDIIGICLVNFAGKILGESTVALREQTMAQSLEMVRLQVRDLQRQNRLAEEDFFGVGFAIAGFHMGDTRYNGPLPLHEWSLIRLGPIVADLFGRPAWIINGAKAGAVAESMFGVGRFIRNFAYLSFNYGFGGGVIIDGELLQSGNGNAGEFSGIFDTEESKRRPALQYLIARLNENGIDVPSIQYMRQNFNPDWPGVAEWVEEVTPAYNRLVNAIRAVTDPQAIVFGGQVPQDLAQMLVERTRIYDRPRYGVVRAHPKMIVSEISSDAAAMGAAIRPFQVSFY